MESRFWADCNLCRGRGDGRVSHSPSDEIRSSTIYRVAPTVRPILQQMADELSNLRSLDARETDGIFSRAKDRIDPVLKPEQRAQLQQFLEERKRRAEESANVPEPRI